ncbi:MAG: hypothetical protein KDD70_12965 [Bdellovibrionales bacterium]|nr:hypothetical protein [Bdellovibrionales bacterium]
MLGGPGRPRETIVPLGDIHSRALLTWSLGNLNGALHRELGVTPQLDKDEIFQLNLKILQASAGDAVSLSSAEIKICSKALTKAIEELESAGQEVDPALHALSKQFKDLTS